MKNFFKNIFCLLILLVAPTVKSFENNIDKDKEITVDVVHSSKLYEVLKYFCVAMADQAEKSKDKTISDFLRKQKISVVTVDPDKTEFEVKFSPPLNELSDFEVVKKKYIELAYAAHEFSKTNKNMAAIMKNFGVKVTTKN